MPTMKHTLGSDVHHSHEQCLSSSVAWETIIFHYPRPLAARPTALPTHVEKLRLFSRGGPGGVAEVPGPILQP